MGTRAETMEFLTDQLTALPGIRTRRMFGEYCVYCDDKPVAFVCDDELFVKPTEAGRPCWLSERSESKPDPTRRFLEATPRPSAG